ncbi:MAG: ComEC/Rec2 family competence protein [Pseudomonadota bacterium]
MAPPAKLRRAWVLTRRVADRWAGQEAGRFIVFAPWLLAVGILLWMAGPLRQPLAVLIAPAGAMAVLWGAAVRVDRPGIVLAARALFFVMAGAALIAGRTVVLRAPVLPDGLPAGEVTGTVERLELRGDDQRFTIRVGSIDDVDAQALPHRVRIVWRGEPGFAKIGDRISMRAQLRPPPGPVLPGGYDFSRQMYYLGIGGSGFAYEAPHVLAVGDGGWRGQLEVLRENVANRVQGHLPGAEGAVAAALITGKRERIPSNVVDALRDAGLAHLLAISGLHMGLVCGYIFWTARFLFTRSERLTLRYPVKKWAAIVALIGGGVYLMLSGAAWSAQRAYIMAAVVFGAILFDRQGLSLRNVAIAATIILLLRPEAVMAPGFQMSFAAVITLIAAFGEIEKRYPRTSDHGLLIRAWRFLSGLSLTSLLAGFATGPFAAFHFGRIATFGLLGNMLAVPIVTLGVMPALVLAMFLMPIGLDAPVLGLVGVGLRVVIGIAQWTASLPGAVGHVAQMAPAGLLLACAGMLALTLLSAPWRLGGALLLLLAFPVSITTDRPEVFLSRDLRNIGVVEDGSLSLLHARRDRFFAEAWLQALGREQQIQGLAQLTSCQDQPCTVFSGEVAVISGRHHLARACNQAKVVILRARSMPGDSAQCAAQVIALDDQGVRAPTALSRDGGGWRVDTVEAFAKAL